ncbi:6831_t:CDS:1, partial [Gigaspora rosea]
PINSLKTSTKKNKRRSNPKADSLNARTESYTKKIGDRSCLNNSNISALNDLIDLLNNNSTLKTLRLRSNRIKSEQVQNLLNVIINNRSLRYLHILNNKIGPKEGKVVWNKLVQVLTTPSDSESSQQPLPFLLFYWRYQSLLRKVEETIKERIKNYD